MGNKTSVVLVGINGYGEMYVKALLDNERVTIAGVVEIALELSPYLPFIKQRSIPIYQTVEEFYAKHSAELAIISTPIHLHTVQATEAMKNGSHVLCEKPLAGDAGDISLWEQASRQSGKWAAIGFNWSFTDTIQEVKQDILRGVFGKPKRLKTLVLWPRSEAYYKRSSWAGREYSPAGDKIRDSIANNAAAHFLHNMLYILGEDVQTSAEVQSVEAELYKVNEIETFDTCALRVWTEAGAELLFYASHATETELGPNFIYEFENGFIEYACRQNNGKVMAYFEDGSTKEYGSLERDQREHLCKLDWCLQAVKDKEMDIPCLFSTATPHLQTIEAIHTEGNRVKAFPPERIHVNKEKQMRSVDGLNTLLTECFQEYYSAQKREWSPIETKLTVMQR
ncbi:Gfo/Idh/MocA family protein [Shouchella shacheensis]|uniref:Gfo/Idh/MocA family protein n=1 Tax=Shouchella shacheensis TaxID=1649580 RepID=UPI0007400766|nr:Gfo/Idh/MocA family oxidoreductase [Shouchella shacheensis]